MEDFFHRDSFRIAFVCVSLAGTTRRVPGHGGGRSVRCRNELLVGEGDDLGGEGMAESIVSRAFDLTSNLFFSSDESSGDDFSLLSPLRGDGRAPLKLLERNCMGKGDDNEVVAARQFE